MSAGSLARRVALSAIAVAALGGASFGLAVAGGHVHFATSKPSLRVKRTPGAALPIAGLAPGDTAQRVIVLQNRSRKTIRRVRFELAERSTALAGGRVVAAPAGVTTPDGLRWVTTCTTTVKGRRRIKRCRTLLRPAPSLLATDPTGLQVTVDLCPKPWTQLPGAAPVYACSKPAKVVVAPTRLPAKRLLKRIPRVRPGGRLYLRMTITLPGEAGNQLQGRTTTLVPSFVVPGGRR